nr:MAG TPA: hypothetical protein [Caudoviricetes sp.]
MTSATMHPPATNDIKQEKIELLVIAVTSSPAPARSALWDCRCGICRSCTSVPDRRQALPPWRAGCNSSRGGSSVLLPPLSIRETRMWISKLLPPCGRLPSEVK